MEILHNFRHKDMLIDLFSYKNIRKSLFKHRYEEERKWIYILDNYHLIEMIMQNTDNKDIKQRLNKLLNDGTSQIDEKLFTAIRKLIEKNKDTKGISLVAIMGTDYIFYDKYNKITIKTTIS